VCEKDAMNGMRDGVFIGRGNVVVKALGGAATNKRVDQHV